MPFEDAGDLLSRRLRHVAALKHLIAQGIDHATLFVHHVVVLEGVLAHQVVLLFDLGLRALDLLGEQPGLDRLLVALHVDGAETIEDPVDAVTGKQPDQVVLGGEEEARLARVTLASGAATQLVVDSPRLVALGADDVQATGVEHDLAVALDLGHRLREALVKGLVVARVTQAQPELRELRASEVLRAATELDIDAAAGHVGRDRHRPGRPASAIVSPSCSACSGFAFSTECAMPRLRRRSERSSETSTEIVPTRTGWLLRLRSAISRSTADHLPALVL